MNTNKLGIIIAGLILCHAAAALAADEDKGDNFYTPRETLGEAKQGDNSLTNESGTTVYTTAQPSKKLGAAGENKSVTFNKAGNPQGNMPKPNDTGNTHSTGASAVVRSGVGVTNGGDTGVQSGVNTMR